MAYLLIDDGDGKERRLPIEDSPLVFGRDEDVDVTIDADWISGRHAEFSADGDYAIHDAYDEVKRWRTLDEGTTWLMLLYVFGSMLIVHFLPKLTKAVPSSLVSICTCLFFVFSSHSEVWG